MPAPGRRGDLLVCLIMYFKVCATSKAKPIQMQENKKAVSKIFGEFEQVFRKSDQQSFWFEHFKNTFLHLTLPSTPSVLAALRKRLIPHRTWAGPFITKNDQEPI